VTTRPPLLAAYALGYGRMPTVAAVLRALPDPTDRPIFRTTATRPLERRLSTG
jgi:hypothetical protein